MGDAAFHLLNLEQIVEEAVALRCNVQEVQVRRWADLGLLPCVGEGEALRFPLTALPLLSELARGDGDTADVQRRADLYAAAAAGLAPAFDSAFEELRQHIDERSVLGELHRMLPVLEPAALATLRGEARLEWRMRQALRELSRLLAGTDVGTSGSRPAVSPEVASPAEELDPAATRTATGPRRLDDPTTTQKTAAAMPDLTAEHDEATAGRRPTPTPRPTTSDTVVPRAFDADATVEVEPEPERPTIRSAPHAAIGRHGEPPAPTVEFDVLRRDADEPAFPGTPAIEDGVGEGQDSEETLPSPRAAAPARSASGAAGMRPSQEAPGLKHEFSALRAAVESARRRMVAESGSAQARTPGEEVLDARRAGSTGARHAETSGVFDAATYQAPDEMSSSELPKVPSLQPAHDLAETDEPRAMGAARRPTNTSRYQSPEGGGAGSSRADVDEEPVSVPRLTPTTGRERSVGQRIVEPGNPYRRAADAPDLASRRATDVLQRSMRNQPTTPHEIPQQMRDHQTASAPGAGRPRGAETVPAEAPDAGDDDGDPADWGVFGEELTGDFEALAEELDALEDPRPADANLDELLATLGASDREAAYRAWARVAPVLRSGDDPGALLGALLLMAELEPVPSEAVAFQLEAADVAAERLFDTRQAFEILAGVVRQNPSHESAFERAAALAEAYGLWAPWYETLEAVVAAAPDVSSLAPVVVAAAAIAREHLQDDDRAEALYERLLDAGVAHPEAVRFLSGRYQARGQHREALELLLSLADVQPADADDLALRSAAEVAAHDLGNADRALDIYEQALLMTGAGSGLREDYVRLARELGASTRGIDFLGGSAAGSPVDRALEKARIALDEFDAADAAIAALQAALPDVGSRRIEVVRELVRIELRRGDAARAAENVEGMLRRADEPAARAELTLLMDEVEEHRGASQEHRAARLRAAVEQGVDDVRVVERLGALWAESGQWDASLDLFALAADRAVERPEEQREWLRRAAWIAADRIADDDAALGFLEEAVTASSGDAEVLYAMAIRCRQTRDRLSEMAALERIVAQGDLRALPPVELARLAELQVARPRGAARSAELLELLLELDELDDDTRDAVDRLLPRIAESSGRHDLHLRWLQRQVKRAASPAEAVVLWKLVVELQDRAEVPQGERVHAVEEALRCAEQTGVSERERAPLHLRAAHARAALAQWDAALAHALRATALFVDTVPGSTQAFRALTVLERVSRDVRDDSEAFRALTVGAEQGGVRERLLLARAAVRTERWSLAIPVLESLVGREAELSEDELAEVREDLARAYRRAPRS